MLGEGHTDSSDDLQTADPFTYPLDEFLALPPDAQNELVERAKKMSSAAIAEHFEQHPKDGWLLIAESPGNIVDHGPMEKLPSDEDAMQHARAIDAPVILSLSPIENVRMTMQSILRLELDAALLGLKEISRTLVEVTNVDTQKRVVTIQAKDPDSDYVIQQDIDITSVPDEARQSCAAFYIVAYEDGDGRSTFRCETVPKREDEKFFREHFADVPDEGEYHAFVSVEGDDDSCSVVVLDEAGKSIADDRVPIELFVETQTSTTTYNPLFVCFGGTRVTRVRQAPDSSDTSWIELMRERSNALVRKPHEK